MKNYNQLINKAKSFYKSNQFENGMIGCIVENGTIISDEISIN